MFEKTKKFIKDHEEDIIVIAGTAVLLVGCGVGLRYGMIRAAKKYEKNNPAMATIWKVLNDIPEGAKIKVYGAIPESGIAPSELGVLGADMIKCGADEVKDVFTHFIAIKKEP